MSSVAMGGSLGRRVFATFVSPRKLFSDFREQAPWAGPLALSVLVGIVVIVLLPDDIFYQGIQGATTRKGVPVEITSDPATVARFERIRLSMGVAVVQPLLACGIAACLTLIFSRLLRGEAEFRHYFAITTHAFLISALGALLILPLQIVRHDPHLHWSLGFLAPFLNAGGAVYRTLGSLNLFTLWMLVVLALGVGSVNRWRSWGGAAVLLLGTYLAFGAGVTLLGG